MTTADRLGRGWSFPVLVDAERGRPLYAEGIEKVRQSIRIIVDTEPGERLMRPDFGCPLRRHLYSPNTDALRADIERDVEMALSTWEPRIAVRAVVASPGDDPSLVLVTIAYELLRDGRQDNLVFPFYLA